MLDVQCAEIWRSQPSQHIDVARTLRNCRFGVLEDVAQPSPCFKKDRLLQHLECSFQHTELEETQEIRQESELCESSSEDDIATLLQEVQVLTASVKRMEEALKVLKDSKSN